MRCLHDKTKVIDSRPILGAEAMPARRRICLRCGVELRTEEVIVSIVKDGKVKKYEHDLQSHL